MTSRCVDPASTLEACQRRCCWYNNSMKPPCGIQLACGFAVLTAQLTFAIGNEPPLRRPVAIQTLPENRVITANHNGSVTVVDLTAGKVLGESIVGRQLSALATVPGSDLLLATDEVAHE